MDKKETRKLINEKKKSFTHEQLKKMSDMVTSRIEENVIFKCAKTVMLYYSLPDEVYTHDFIEKWHGQKDIILPVVSDNEMFLRKYEGKDSMKKGAYNIYEPQGEAFADLESIDMIIVPGVGFDTKGNRLGRGKGYYDKFLKDMNVKFKLGVCFDFQIFDNIPTNGLDIPMNEVWTESGCISRT